MSDGAAAAADMLAMSQAAYTGEQPMLQPMRTTWTGMPRWENRENQTTASNVARPGPMGMIRVMADDARQYLNPKP